jgi:hypothetical protein
MADNIDKIAARLGAQVIGSVPHAGGGAFGAARLSRIVAELRSRLAPGQGRRAGRPTDVAWVLRPKVPMTKRTERQLTRLAERANASGRRVTPVQVAARILEEALSGLPEG